MRREMIGMWLLVMLLMVGSARADEVFDQANAAYDAGQFTEAVDGYEMLLERDGPRVAVFQNLGSAYHRLGNDGRSILAFERALLLKPGDADLVANLKMARESAAVFPLERVSGWGRVSGLLTRRQWSWMALVMGLAVPLVVGLWWKLGGHAAGWLLGLLVLVSVTAFSLWEIDRRAGEAWRGIVVADGGKVLVSPFAKADERGTLVAGREVRLGKEEGEYFWAEDPGGSLAGWMSKEEVESVIPRQD